MPRINYIWDNKHPVSAPCKPNAYTDRTQMLVDRKRRWQSRSLGQRTAQRG
jgi:hypothetical protein